MLCKHKSDGAALVEFAVLLPIMLMMIYGIIEYSLIMLQVISLDDAVRNTARLTASLDDSDCRLKSTAFLNSALGIWNLNESVSGFTGTPASINCSICATRVPA